VGRELDVMGREREREGESERERERRTDISSVSACETERVESPSAIDAGNTCQRD